MINASKVKEIILSTQGLKDGEPPKPCNNSLVIYTNAYKAY